jgi:hypothetical protein
MTCKDIIVTKSDTVLEVTSNENIINLTTNEVVDLEIESETKIIELKEDFSNVIEVTNVNTVGVAGFYQSFIPTTGQTVFTLNNIPTGAQIILSQVYINGQKIAYITCYTITGTQLTVILPYSLNNEDFLEIYY